MHNLATNCSRRWHTFFTISSWVVRFMRRKLNILGKENFFPVWKRRKSFTIVITRYISIVCPFWLPSSSFFLYVVWFNVSTTILMFMWTYTSSFTDEFLKNMIFKSQNVGNMLKLAELASNFQTCCHFPSFSGRIKFSVHLINAILKP